jgi:hypothetical protein
MAAAFTLTTQNDEGKLRRAIGTIAFSGSYTATGDTLDLTGKGILASQPPIVGHIRGQAGFQYPFVKGTTLANGKVQIRVNDAGGANTANGEHTAASVVAGVTGDTVVAEFLFNKE